MSLVDWQLSRYGSPAIDLLHNLFSSTDQALRQTDYQNLLRHYHNSLAGMITRLGSDPNQLFTFDNLLDEMKRFGLYACAISPFAQQVVMADSVPNLNECSQSLADDRSKRMRIVNDFGQAARQMYVKRINGIMSDLVNLGYYNKE